MTRTQNGPTPLKFHIVKKRRLERTKKKRTNLNQKKEKEIKATTRSSMTENHVFDLTDTIYMTEACRCCYCLIIVVVVLVDFCGCHGWRMVWSADVGVLQWFVLIYS